MLLSSKKEKNNESKTNQTSRCNVICCCFSERKNVKDKNVKDIGTSPENGYKRIEDIKNYGSNDILKIQEGIQSKKQSKEDNHLIEELIQLQKDYNILKEILNQNVSLVNELNHKIAKHKCPVHSECQSNIKCRHTNCKLSHLYQKNKNLKIKIEDLKQEAILLYKKLNFHKKQVKDKQIIINQKSKELRDLEEKAIGLTETYKNFEKNNKNIRKRKRSYEK